MRCFNTLLIATLLWAGALVPASTRAEDGGQLLEADNFALLGERAATDQLPIVIAVVAEGCPYCDLLEREFLKPMIISGDYEGKRALLRTLHMDHPEQRIDFNGKSMTALEIARHYKVFVTPTLLFLSGDGHELAERMIGINSVDYFGAYLDAAIDESLSRLRAPRAVSAVDARPAGVDG
jgi:thioredoxin-related protein